MPHAVCQMLYSPTYTYMTPTPTSRHAILACFICRKRRRHMLCSLVLYATDVTCYILLFYMPPTPTLHAIIACFICADVTCYTRLFFMSTTPTSHAILSCFICRRRRRHMLYSLVLYAADADVTCLFYMSPTSHAILSCFKFRRRHMLYSLVLYATDADVTCYNRLFYITPYVISFLTFLIQHLFSAQNTVTSALPKRTNQRNKISYTLIMSNI